MKTITVNGKELKLEYSFEAAENRDIVQKMFQFVSGSFVYKRLTSPEASEVEEIFAAFDGSAEMLSEFPHVCRLAFYVGLLENNPVSEAEAKELMKQYMKDNKLSFFKLYEEIKGIMEDDGFFVLSGIEDMLEKMNESAEKAMEAEKKITKIPKDHKPKQTSTSTK